MKTVTASGICLYQLSRTLHVDVEYQVLAGGAGFLQNAPVGAVIIAKNLGPFQEFVARRPWPRSPPRATKW